jgi:DNA-binding transcriptional LysR family regulator
MLDRYQLRYFLAVVDAGNFSRAAARVNVTQPTLSVGISKLEQALGAKLFFRNSQRVHLTEAGVRFLSHARAIEREFNALETRVSGSDAAAVVRVGVLTTVPVRLLEALVVANGAAPQQPKLEILDGSERDLLSRLQEGRIDLAIALVRPGETRFAHEILLEESYALAVPEWHRLAKVRAVEAEDLADEVMIVRRHCEALSETSRHFTERGVRPRFSYRTTNDERALAMVRAGLGITVMPDGFREEGVLRPRLAGFEPKRTIGLLHRMRPGDANDATAQVAASVRSVFRGLH